MISSDSVLVVNIFLVADCLLMTKNGRLVSQDGSGKRSDVGLVCSDDLVGGNAMSFELIFEVSVSGVFFSSHLFHLGLKGYSCRFVIVMHLLSCSFKFIGQILSNIFSISS